MFYIINLTNGEVLGEGSSASIDAQLATLSATHPLDTLRVQAACDSNYGLSGEDWLGVA